MLFRKFFNKQVDIYLSNLGYYIMDFPTTYDKYNYPHRVIYMNQKYNTFIEVDKHDTNEYWGKVYLPNFKDGILYTKMMPAVITSEELYGVFNKVRALNRNTRYKYYRLKNIDMEIAYLGYTLVNSNFPLYSTYIKHDMDGNDAIRIYIYREKDDNNNSRHVLKAENADGLAGELNELELYLFYKQLQTISAEYNKNKEIANRMLSEGRFD